MKMAMIGVVALLVLGGGATGAYFYFSKPAEAALTEEQAAAAEEAAAVEAAAAGEQGQPIEAAKVEFVELEPLVLPIIDKSGVSQTVSLVVALEVPDVATADEVKRMAPRLKDAFIQDMYGTLHRQAARDGSVIQVSAIKERLTRASAKVLGENKVNQVLLQVVQQRPM